MTTISRYACLPILLLAAVACAAGPSLQSAGPLAPTLQSMVDRHLISGAVALVADREKVLEVDAVGYESLGTHEPMRPDDLFWIASMTKSITATAFMTLVDEGKVNIEDPVEKYLPEFKGQMVLDEKDPQQTPHPPRHPVTIRECLTHTSGLIRANDKRARRFYDLAKNVAGYASMPLIREPGTKYEYNNCGISTVGRVIEVVSGMPYARFVQQRVLDPLEMTHTVWWPDAGQAKHLARTSRLNADKTGIEDVQQDKNLTPAGVAKFANGVPVPPQILADFGGGILPDYGNHFAEPAGGLFSTAPDLGHLCQMLLNRGLYRGKRLLSDKAVSLMTSVETGSIPVTPTEAYGLGWSVKIKPDEGLPAGSFGHRGARRTVMWVDPTHGLAVVLLFERFDMPGPDQKTVYTSFFKSAVDAYGGNPR